MNRRHEADDADRSHVPGWMRAAWFLGRPPALTRHQWKVLGLVSIVSLFEQYDVYLFALNLKHIQADLGIAEGSVGLLGSAVRLGALGSVLVTLLADRLGRRRILLFTVVAYTLLTGATALAPDASTFVVLQMLSRLFASAETLLAVVVIAEEFDAEHRGWGIGALGALQACGAGMASVFFAAVDLLPGGWRALYLVGLGPLLLVAWWRRTLPETKRFEQLELELRAAPPLAPLVGLVRAYPARFAALAGAVFMLSLYLGPAGTFGPKYLQDVHGWTPANVALLNLLGGGLAIVANPFSGWLSDRRGRRRVTTAFTLALPLAAFAFYQSPVAGVALASLWSVWLFALFGSEVMFAAYGAELFPTSYRSTASGARGLFSTFGGVAGLALVSVLFPLAGSNWNAIALIAVGGLVVPLIVLAALPETAGRVLEEIAPERAPAPAPVVVLEETH